jgi:lipopolysaccharide/colanic/teichoic acid biosynthesis glycosyltransferase
MKYESHPVINMLSRFELTTAHPSQSWLERSGDGPGARATAPSGLTILHPAARAIKRLADIIGALAGIGLLSPVILLISLLIYLDSPGPILYSQRRVGKDGRPFRLWKFRTMVAAGQAGWGAQGFEPDRWPEWEIYQKIRHDPRVTRLGRFLRRYSLDEIPQLWNVLLGEMSLVGPRPCFYEQVSYYGASFDQYIQVRPGMSGLWQVSGRNNTTFLQRVALDADYVLHWSPGMECRILWRTIWVVLRGEGAF